MSEPEEAASETGQGFGSEESRELALETGQDWRQGEQVHTRLWPGRCYSGGAGARQAFGRLGDVQGETARWSRVRITSGPGKREPVGCETGRRAADGESKAWEQRTGAQHSQGEGARRQTVAICRQTARMERAGVSLWAWMGECRSSVAAHNNPLAGRSRRPPNLASARMRVPPFARDTYPPHTLRSRACIGASLPGQKPWSSSLFLVARFLPENLPTPSSAIVLSPSVAYLALAPL